MCVTVIKALKCIHTGLVLLHHTVKEVLFCVSLLVTVILLLHSDRDAKYCNHHVCLSVCLPVCPFTHIS